MKKTIISYHLVLLLMLFAGPSALADLTRPLIDNSTEATNPQLFLPTELIPLTGYPFSGPFVSTLSSSLFQFSNEKIDRRGDERTVRVLENSDPMAYKVWMQETPAEIVVVLPGLGGHFRTDTALNLVDILYQQGYSVVTIANAFNFEFMLRGSSQALPGYTPEDTKSVHHAISQVIRDLKSDHVDQITGIHLTGYSMGALHTLFLADFESKQPVSQKIGISKYVAINPPIDLYYSLKLIDKSFYIYKEWSQGERKQVYLNSVAKADQITSTTDGNKQIDLLQTFSEEESQALIGSLFRATLNEILEISVKVKGQIAPNVLNGPLKDLYDTEYSDYNRRDFKTITFLNYGFENYFRKAVLPHYQAIDPSLTDEKMIRQSGLVAIEETLSADPNIRILHSVNDVFMHNPDSLRWLKDTMGDRLSLFDNGGHVGAIYSPRFRSTYINSFR